MSEPGFECPECGTKLNSTFRCMLCGWKRHLEDETPKVSCWTCDACHARTPGQPVMYQPDGPSGALRGLCSGCHFEQRIKTTVRATPEEVAANLKAIREMLERVAIRMHV